LYRPSISFICHPQDRSREYKDLEYWIDLAKILEKGIFDGVFLADVLGIYDVYQQSAEHALTGAVQVPVNDPPSRTCDGCCDKTFGIWSDNLYFI
jgi:hypothetical protein